MPDASAPAVFRSRFNSVISIVIWSLCAVIAGSLFLIPAGLHLLYLVPLVFACVVAFELLWRPQVEVGAQGTTLINPFRTVEIPWDALIHVDTKYALTLYTPGHAFTAWAAPAPGRAFGYKNAFPGRAAANDGPVADGKIRPSDLITSESGEAAYLVRKQWEAMVADGTVEAGRADQTAPVIRLHWAAIVIAVVLFGATLVAMATA